MLTRYDGQILRKLDMAGWVATDQDFRISEFLDLTLEWALDVNNLQFDGRNGLHRWLTPGSAETLSYLRIRDLGQTPNTKSSLRSVSLLNGAK